MEATIETKEERIDGLLIMSTPITALRAFSLLAKIGKHATPLLKAISGNFAKAAAAAGKAGGKVQLFALLAAGDMDKFVEAIQGAFASLSAGEAEQLARDILISTIAVDEEKGEKFVLSSEREINRAFTGRLPTMFRVIAFALKVNFGDFSSAVSALSLASKPETASLST